MDEFEAILYQINDLTATDEHMVKLERLNVESQFLEMFAGKKINNLKESLEILDQLFNNRKQAAIMSVALWSHWDI